VDSAKSSVQPGELQGKANEELVEAARHALAFYQRLEQHAPPEMAFGGEAAVARRLRRAIGRVSKDG
jgi:hypothetical protein